MTDPTAAERARRYRARRRERDAGVTSRTEPPPIIAPVLLELLAEIRELRAELVKASYPQSAPAVDKRDVTRRHAVQRDVTQRHGGEGAPAPARVRTRVPGPTGPRDTLGRDRDVTPAEAVLEILRHAPAPASIDAIADALDAPTAEVARALVGLVEAGLVLRLPGATSIDRDRWAPVAVTSPGETVRCSDYQAHRFEHRRDPASGRFRCYVCEPELAQVEVQL